jgi:hypothetical protein
MKSTSLLTSAGLTLAIGLVASRAARTAAGGDGPSSSMTPRPIRSGPAPCRTSRRRGTTPNAGSSATRRRSSRTTFSRTTPGGDASSEVAEPNQCSLRTENAPLIRRAVGLVRSRLPYGELLALHGTCACAHPSARRVLGRIRRAASPVAFGRLAELDQYPSGSRM